MADKILLYKHDYSKPNVLELLTNVEQLNDGTVVEIVFKGEPDNSSYICINNIAQPNCLNVCIYVCNVYIKVNGFNIGVLKPVNI